MSLISFYVFLLLFLLTDEGLPLEVSVLTGVGVPVNAALSEVSSVSECVTSSDFNSSDVIDVYINVNTNINIKPRATALWYLWLRRWSQISQRHPSSCGFYKGVDGPSCPSGQIPVGLHSVGPVRRFSSHQPGFSLPQPTLLSLSSINWTKGSKCYNLYRKVQASSYVWATFPDYASLSQLVLSYSLCFIYSYFALGLWDCAKTDV